ncbi:MAG: hypothetical protein AB1529_01740 [Candidatus Micrarchaeota archaeon]
MSAFRSEERTACEAGKRFGRYRAEQEGTVRPIAVKKDPLQEELLGRFTASFRHDVAKFTDNYGLAKEAIAGLTYSPNDVAGFALPIAALPYERYLNSKTGWFLSALINEGRHKIYHVALPFLEEPVAYFAFRNVKNVRVAGDVGADCAREMAGGRLVIEGDAGDGLAALMNGGKVIVLGQAGKYVGDRLYGGEIHLLGGYESISKDCCVPCGGRIFIGKRKVVDGLWSAEGVLYG